jgi:hypothetical protein
VVQADAHPALDRHVHGERAPAVGEGGERDTAWCADGHELAGLEAIGIHPQRASCCCAGLGEIELHRIGLDARPRPNLPAGYGMQTQHRTVWYRTVLVRSDGDDRL